MARAILIVIDGCRLDALEKAATPHLDSLAANGARAAAESVCPPLTLPVHFSIFTSLTPLNHGVLTNAANPAPSRAAIGLIDLAKMQGLSTAALYNWEHLRNLSTEGMLDFVVCLSGSGQDNGDERLTDAALDLIAAHGPDLVFLYLGWLDVAGHDHGWMSAEYLEALEAADRQVGRIVDSVSAENRGEAYDIFILSDHGGEGHNHEKPLPEVMTVPWIASGPSIREGLVLEERISLLDTAPTLARVLELPHPPHWQGRVIEEILL